MRNTEYTATVLQMLREGKTEKQIALATQRHRNTVSRHVNWLRHNFAIEPQLLTNEILSKLRERIDNMENRDLVRFLAVLMPQKIEATSTHTERIIKVELSSRLMSNKSCLNNQESILPMNPTINKQNSTKPDTITVTEQPLQE